MDSAQAPSQNIDRDALTRLWRMALEEDGVDADVTAHLAFVEDRSARAWVRARERGVFAGCAVLELLAEHYPDELSVTVKTQDGERIERGTDIACIEGPAQRIVTLERTLLNFLQHLSGVATFTNRFVEAIAGSRARIYDTRKTIPGLRVLDKYAVRCGGGVNHRFGLHDAVLVKDNHLAGIAVDQLAVAASEMLRRRMTLDRQPAFVEFEADNLEQVDELLRVSGIDVILLDNFSPGQMREAVALRDRLGLAGKVDLEASGNVTLDTVGDIAATGVDRISVGAITHSAPALDIGLDFE